MLLTTRWAGKGRAFAKAYALTDDNGKRAMQLALIEKD